MNKNSPPAGQPERLEATQPPETDRSSGSVRLGAELGVDQADSLKTQLMETVGRDGTVTLDASEVQRIHTAALQLLCMFCRDRRNAGREVSWKQPSTALRSAAALLGATTLLRLGMEQEQA